MNAMAWEEARVNAMDKSNRVRVGLGTLDRPSSGKGLKYNGHAVTREPACLRGTDSRRD